MMPTNPSDARRLSGEASGAEADDRAGMDALATAIEAVAEQLPSNFQFPDRSVEPPFEDRFRRTGAGGASFRQWGGRLAAALLACVLAFPFLSTWWNDGVEPRAPSGGLVAMEWLSPPRPGARGAGGPVSTLSLPRNGPVVLVLDIPREARVALRDGAEVELSRSGPQAGDPLLKLTIDARAWQSQLASHDGLPLWLDSTIIAPGPHRLQLRPLADGTSAERPEPALVLEFHWTETE